MGWIWMKIKHNWVVVKKVNRGDESSKQFTSNYTSVTEALKPGFGTAKYFVQRSKDGKEADAGNINYSDIQEFFSSNLIKLYSLEHCVVLYVLKKKIQWGNSLMLQMLILKRNGTQW